MKASVERFPKTSIVLLPTIAVSNCKHYYGYPVTKIQLIWLWWNVIFAFGVMDIHEKYPACFRAKEGEQMADRDCKHCKHYKPKTLKEGCAYAWGCEIWDCKFEPTGPDNGGSECGK